MDKMRCEFESAMKPYVWLTFELDPDNSELYADTETHCAWLGWQAALAQKAAMPSNAQEVIDFIGSNFNSMETSDNLENVKFNLTVHDLLSCFEQMIDFPQIKQA